MWSPPVNTIKLSAVTAASLRRLVAKATGLARRVKFAILMEGAGAEAVLTSAERAHLRNAAITVYRYIPASMVPLDSAQRWVDQGPWGGAPPQLDDDESRLGWATFADAGALLRAIQTLQPATAAHPAAKAAKAPRSLAPANLTLADLGPVKMQATEAPTLQTGVNEDVKALIQAAYKLSQLPVAARAANTSAARAVVARLIDLATPEAVQEATDVLKARYDLHALCKPEMSVLECVQVVAAAAFDPWMLLDIKGGEPPVITIIAESAITNPNRPLSVILTSWASVEPADRPALTDSVRAFLARAWEGALGPARLLYVDDARKILGPNWFKDPWQLVLPTEKHDPPARILVENQGETHDGGMFDDPSDDTTWEKVKFGTADWFSDWGPSILEYNPFALYVAGIGAAGAAVGEKLEKAGKAASAFVKPLAIGAAVVTVAVVALVVLRKK